MLKPFDGAEHGDRRRDDRVAVKQRRADNADQKQKRRALAQRALRQRHQRQRAALALIVHAQHEHDIFERHQNHQRPKDERDDADHFAAFKAIAGDVLDRFTEGIERAGADIAIDDADRTKRERPKAGMPVCARRIMGGFSSGRGRVLRGLRHIRLPFGAQASQPRAARLRPFHQTSNGVRPAGLWFG